MKYLLAILILSGCESYNVNLSLLPDTMTCHKYGQEWLCEVSHDNMAALITSCHERSTSF